jgi:Kef-type K+ transport system membrane component KefB
LVEKLEDLVNILFIPIVGLIFLRLLANLTLFLQQYFVLSGLRTDLSALNTGTAWGYTVLLCVVSFCAKFVPCYTAAAFTGFNWRESGAIGALMACKGYVEQLGSSSIPLF